MVTKRYIREKISLLADFKIYLTEEQIEYMRSLNEEYKVDQYAHKLIQEKDWDRVVEVGHRQRDRKPRMDIRQDIKKFLAKNIGVQKIDYAKYNYDNITSAYSTIHACCARSGLPVRLSKRGDCLYFVRTDV